MSDGCGAPSIQGAEPTQAEPTQAETAPFAVEVVTLVPQLWPNWLHPTSGLIGKAFQAGRAKLQVNDLRAFGHGPHRQVDDSPFGGGAGMVLAVPPLHAAITQARARTPGPVLLLSPRGRPFNQARAEALARGPGMTLVCGRYEGFDERVYAYADDTIALGDFVLTAGDPAALSIIDAVVRLLPQVVGNPASLLDESFTRGGLEYPQYTRPVSYDGAEVPGILRSGNHSAIHAWRQTHAKTLTAQYRPDLLQPER